MVLELPNITATLSCLFGFFFPTVLKFILKQCRNENVFVLKSLTTTRRYDSVRRGAATLGLWKKITCRPMCMLYIFSLFKWPAPCNERKPIQLKQARRGILIKIII